MTYQDDLSRGIEAVKNGDLETARNLLANVVKSNPDSQEGWLWLGNCLQDKDQRKYCYERVLNINPKNVEAQENWTNYSSVQFSKPPTSFQSH